MPDPKTGLPRLTEVGCWSHARRKVYEVYEATASPLAKEALERIAELFAIEERINGRASPERLAARQRDAVPLLAELETFLHKALNQISGKSTLAKAIRYQRGRVRAGGPSRRTWVDPLAEESETIPTDPLAGRSPVFGLPRLAS